MAVLRGREHAHRSPRLGEPPFELVVSKLRRPSPRPGTVRRSVLIERLARGDPRPVVSVVAPAGYGKTTLLSQWAERDGQAFAWVSLDEHDNDLKVLLTYVAEALDAVEPMGEQVFEALVSRASPIRDSAVSALGSAFASMTSSVVLVLDDVHVLYDHDCRAALPVLADFVPPGSRLVLAGRDAPPLPVARLRTAGRITQIGPGDLVLSHEEASSLLRNAGVPVTEDDVAELHRRTEGWPAGLYLAALNMATDPVANPADSFAGDHQLVSQYVESEFLARLSRWQRLFLTRTAVLERFCGSLCEAVLEQPGAARTLAYLAQSHPLLPLDTQAGWYRHHHLLRDFLLAELRRLEPDLIPILRRRAARWCLQNGLPEEAVEYYIAAGDVDTVAGLVAASGIRAYRKGLLATVQRWVGWLEERDGTEGRPMVAVLAGLLSAVTGRAADAERWADVLDCSLSDAAPGPEDPAAGAWAALLRVFPCQHGVKQMRADADEAARRFAAAGVPESAAALMQGIARTLSGDIDAGDAFLGEAVSLAEVTGAPDVEAAALCERALAAMARNEWDKAEVFAGRARSVMRRAGIGQSCVALLVCAAQARIALHWDDVSTARQELVSALRLRPLLTQPLPHLAVQARIELARVHLALSDPAGAATLMREVDELLTCRPGLGSLVTAAQALRARLSEEDGPAVPGVPALTPAELRLLPVLGTHLSFPQIGAELHLSPNTVKSEAISIYRKLRVSSRTEAVAEAYRLGLLPE